MGAFDHVLVLLSFVYALALTHLLSRVGALALARDRVRYSGLLVICAINAILFVFANWLSLWDLRGMHGWDLFSVVSQFLFAIAIYFVCAFAAPEAAGDTAIDMEAFYWRNHRLYYAAVMVCLLLSLIINAEVLKTPNAALFLEENAMVLPMIVFGVLPLVVRAHWAHWVAGLGLLGLLAGFTIEFSSTLTS